MKSSEINSLAREWLKHLKKNYLGDNYSWVGIYWMESFISPEAKNSTDLVLGPYIGFETPHTRISLQKGLCGRAIRENQTLNIDNVNASPEYLSCSLETKSEIVIPLRMPDGTPFGELDVDAKTLAAFSSDLQKILEQECSEISKKIYNVL
jgi:GAF domain-containing protein